MSPDIPRLNLRSLLEATNEMTFSADRRPYLPPRRVFVSVPPRKPAEPPDARSHHPLNSSERPTTPPLISSPASLGPASPRNVSSPTQTMSCAKNGSRTAPTKVNYWKCLRKTSPLDPCPAITTQAAQRAGHNRVRSAGAAVSPPASLMARVQSRPDRSDVRNSFGFLLAGGNVQTGLPQGEVAASSPPCTREAPDASLTPPLRSDGSSTVKTIKRRRASRERDWSNSLKGVRMNLSRIEKTVLASMNEVERRMVAHLDEQTKCLEDRLMNIEGHLSRLQLSDPLSKKSLGVAPRDSSARLHKNNAPTTCSTATAGPEEFQLCSDMKLQRRHSSDTLFDNLSERKRSPLQIDSSALLRATESLTTAVSALLQRIEHKQSDTDDDDQSFESGDISDSGGGTQSVKVMQVK